MCPLSLFILAMFFGKITRSQLSLEFLDWAIARQVRFSGVPEDIRAMIQKRKLARSESEIVFQNREKAWFVLRR
jgi:hypothetical protein